MSMMAAIDLAVLLQLVSDNKPGYGDYARVMGPDITGPPAYTGYGYDRSGMEVFLQRVAMRLKCDQPSLDFDWASTDAAKCQTANRDTLIGLIARDTTAAPGGK
jgi:hypothetical protein